MICVCRVSDRMLRQVAKRDNLPLRWLREVKRMHNLLRIHEWFGEYAVEPPAKSGDADTVPSEGQSK